MRNRTFGPALALLAVLALAGVAAAASVRKDLVPEPAAPSGASGWVIVNPTPKGAVVQVQVKGLPPEAKLFLHVGDMGDPVGEFLTDTHGNGRLHVNHVEIEGTSVDVEVHDDEHVALMKATVDLPEERP